MKTMINRAMFEQVDRDSASITVLSAVIHRFEETGRYSGFVSKGDREVAIFEIVVKDENGPPVTGEDEVNIMAFLGDAFSSVTTVDLRELDLSVIGATMVERRFYIRKGGSVLFYVPKGEGKYSIMIRKNGEAEEVVLDTKALDRHDAYLTLCLRPGTYIIRNEIAQTEARLTVPYPMIGKGPRRPRPLEVQCSKRTIRPKEMRITPFQPLLFQFTTPSRVTIKLREPDDGPGDREAMSDYRPYK